MSVAPRRAELRAYIDIHAPILAVWDLVTSPGADGLDLEPGETAYRAPGTGPGVGEVHVHVRRRPGELSRLTVLQVTVFDVGVKASATVISPPAPMTALTLDHTLERVDGAVRLTAVTTIEVSERLDDAVAERLLSGTTSRMAAEFETLLRRYKDHLEAPPTARP